MSAAALTVAMLWDLYQALRSHRKSFRITRARMRAVLVHFGPRPIAEIRPRDWYVYRDRRKTDDPDLGTAISPLTINFELDWFRAMLNWGVVEDHIAYSPLAAVRRESVDSQRDTTLDDDSLDRLVAVSPPILKAFVLAAVDTGMRAMEVLTLRWAMIDGDGYVSLPKSSTKSRRRRTVKLSGRALTAMAALPREDDQDFVFKTSDVRTRVGHASYRRMAKLWRVAATAAGLQAAAGDGQVRIHDLRHTFATNAIRKGVPLPVVQRMTGHATLSMLGRYVHAGRADIDSAITRMERRESAPTAAPVAADELAQLRVQVAALSATLARLAPPAGDSP